MLSSKTPIGSVGIMSGLPAVLEEFAWSLCNLASYTGSNVCGPDQYVHYIRTRHSFHSAARNDLAKQTMGEWSLQLDTDHAPEPDLIHRLINFSRLYQCPVVTGMYLMKTPPHGPVLWKIDANGEKRQLADWKDGEAIAVDAGGGGCLFVQSWVYRKIWDELKEEPFSTAEYPGTFGEDFAFYDRCKRIGVKPVVAPWIECPHLVVKALTVDADYDRAAVRSLEVAAERVEQAV